MTPYEWVPLIKAGVVLSFVSSLVAASDLAGACRLPRFWAAGMLEKGVLCEFSQALLGGSVSQLTRSAQIVASRMRQAKNGCPAIAMRLNLFLYKQKILYNVPIN